MSPARTGKGRQRKGREFERSILRDLWERSGRKPPWTPHSRPDDGYRPPPALTGIHLEMKRQERLNFWAAIEQAQAEAPHPNAWAVIFQRSHGERCVILPYEEWVKLVL